MNNKPTTREECFAQLDAMLSETDKQELRKSGDAFEFHFTLGLWIRNNWLYERSEEEIEQLCKAFDTYLPAFAADELSSEIIEAYQKHLRKKNKLRVGTI